MADVSGQEAQVVEALKNGGQQIPERYDEGPEIEPGEFKGLRDEEIVALYGTLADVSIKEMAEALDVSSATVSNYRSRLVDQDYLKNLQPGRGRPDYRPGIEIKGLLKSYEEQIPVLEDVNLPRPLETEEEEMRWVLGEEIYELVEEGLYDDLGGKEALALEMTLEGKSRDEIAGFLDVAPGTVSSYRTRLVEKGYMRNLNPGRGPGEYIPGEEVIETWDEYTPEIEMLEANPARPLEGGEGLNWLLGEEISEILSEAETEGNEETGEQEVDASDTDFRLNGYSEAEVAALLTRVEDGDTGFGRIAEEIGQETAHSMADDLEDEGLLEEDREQVSGLAVTEQGENYLENVDPVDNNGESSNGSISGSSTSSRSRGSTSSSRSRRSSNGRADERILDLGDKLLDGHEEEISQDEDTDLKSHIAESEEEVEMEDNNAGYTGFT